MKKVFFLICAMIAFLTLETKAQEFKFGLQAGFGASDVKTQNNEIYGFKIMNSEVKTSYSINGYLGFKSKTFWGVSMEPGLIQKGFREPSNSPAFEPTDLNLYYLQIPVLIDFHLGNSFAVSAGMDFSLLIDAIAKTGSRSSSAGGYDNSEVSAIIGTHFKITEHMDTGIRFSHALKPVLTFNFTDDNGQPLSDEFKAFNRYLQVFFRYTI